MSEKDKLSEYLNDDDVVGMLKREGELLQLARSLIKLPSWERRRITAFHYSHYLEYRSLN